MIVALFLAALLQACGGGGEATPVDSDAPSTDAPVSPAPPPPPPPPLRTQVELASAPGDTLGEGASHSYTRADAGITVTPGTWTASTGTSRLAITAEVFAYERWEGAFVFPLGMERIERGTYTIHADDAVQSSAGWRRRLLWGPGAANGCTETQPGRTEPSPMSVSARMGIGYHPGTFTVESVEYEGTELRSFALRFEMRCGNSASAFTGRVEWRADDATQVAGPVAAPAALWDAPAGAVPATGNYLYLQSDAGDPVGNGQATLVSGPDWILVPSSGVNPPHRNLFFRADRLDGAASWSAQFQPMSSLARPTVGYYPDLRGDTSLQNMTPVMAMMAWTTTSPEGMGTCSAPAGLPGRAPAFPYLSWLAIDHIRYAGDDLVELDLRFEQRCAGQPAALRGKLHWVAPAG